METPSLAAVLAILPGFPEDIVVQHVAVEAGVVFVRAHTQATHACCPSCATRSTRVQGSYVRTLADLAWQGTPVRVRLRVRRFRCNVARCPRRTFTERLPTLAPSHARRTGRMADLMTRVGMALGGEASARLLPFLGAPTSADTVLRLLRRVPTPTAATPRVLGVDEWAHRKGHRYGTILVDLERREPVDLLPDRSAESVAAWLVEHPGVEFVTRDRSETYAEGVRQGAPEAVQIADRWHLLKNAGEVVERILHRHRPALEQAAVAVVTPPEVAPPTPATAVPSPPTPPTAPPPATSRERLPRQVWYDQIHALRREGLSVRAISRRIGVSPPTVRKYLHATVCPTRAARRTKIGTFTAFDTHLRRRWEEGCRDAVVLWPELKALGFRGSLRSVQRHVERWRAREGGGDPATRAPSRSPLPAKAPSPRQVRWWLVLPTARLTTEQQRYVHELTTASPPIRAAQELAVEFGCVLRAHDVSALEPWLVRAETGDLTEFREFAAGLRRDEAAVRAAIEHVWSNGQTEGQVNKLKMLKRQMYGRASVALLRQRLLHAA